MAAGLCLGFSPWGALCGWFCGPFEIGDLCGHEQCVRGCSGRSIAARAQAVSGFEFASVLQTLAHATQKIPLATVDRRNSPTRGQF